MPERNVIIRSVTLYDIFRLNKLEFVLTLADISKLRIKKIINSAFIFSYDASYGK